MAATMVIAAMHQHGDDHVLEGLRSRPTHCSLSHTHAYVTDQFSRVILRRIATHSCHGSFRINNALDRRTTRNQRCNVLLQVGQVGRCLLDLFLDNHVTLLRDGRGLHTF